MKKSRFTEEQIITTLKEMEPVRNTVIANVNQKVHHSDGQKMHHFGGWIEIFSFGAFPLVA